MIEDFAARALGLAAILLSSHSWAADAPAQTESCALRRYASVDLVVTNEIWLPVTLEGQTGWMILNTGSGVSVLWKHVAKELDLRRRKLNTSARARFGKEVITETAAVTSLDVGAAGFGEGEFAVVTLDPTVKEPPPRTFGALGMDVLGAVDFELDLANKKLNLYSPDHCPGQVVYWTDNYASTPLMQGALGNLYFAVEVDDQLLEATISSGSETTKLNTDVSKRLYGFDASSPGIEISADPETGETNAHFRAMHIAAPGLTVKNTAVKLIAPRFDCSIDRRRPGTKAAGYESRCFGAFPIHLGRNVLQKLRLYFATKEKVLYYSAAQ